MINHKADSQCWKDLEAWAASGSRASTDHCILELRSRIESLEEDSYEENKSIRHCFEALVQRIEKLEKACLDNWIPEVPSALLDLRSQVESMKDDCLAIYARLDRLENTAYESLL
jgi:ubiquinone biosynthesis protein UbiJ